MDKIQTIIIMTIFSLLFGCGKSDVKSLTPIVDLKLFSVDYSILNKPISSSDKFYAYFKTKDVLNLSKDGIEIGTKNDVLDYAFITLNSFKGRFLLKGNELQLTQKNHPESIVKIFGEPYWIDRSDGEVILFYEYKKGIIELQFEFYDSIHLSHITCMINGVLSSEKDRKSYNVNKPWPPDEG